MNHPDRKTVPFNESFTKTPDKPNPTALLPLKWRLLGASALSLALSACSLPAGTDSSSVSSPSRPVSAPQSQGLENLSPQQQEREDLKPKYIKEATDTIRALLNPNLIDPSWGVRIATIGMQGYQENDGSNAHLFGSLVFVDPQNETKIHVDAVYDTQTGRSKTIQLSIRDTEVSNKNPIRDEINKRLAGKLFMNIPRDEFNKPPLSSLHKDLLLHFFGHEFDNISLSLYMMGGDDLKTQGYGLRGEKSLENGDKLFAYVSERDVAVLVVKGWTLQPTPTPIP